MKSVTNLDTNVTPYILTGSRYIPGATKQTAVYSHLDADFHTYLKDRIKAIFRKQSKLLPETDRPSYIGLTGQLVDPESTNGLLMEAWFEYLAITAFQPNLMDDVTVVLSTAAPPATSPYLNLAYYSGLDYNIPITFKDFDTYGSLAPCFNPKVDTEYMLFVDGQNSFFNRHIDQDELIDNFNYYGCDMLMAASSHQTPDEYAYLDEKYAKDVKLWFKGMAFAGAASTKFPFCNSNSFMCRTSFFYDVFYKKLQETTASEVVARLGSKKPLVNHDLGTSIFQATYPNSQLDRECRIFQPIDYGVEGINLNFNIRGSKEEELHKENFRTSSSSPLPKYEPMLIPAQTYGTQIQECDGCESTQQE